MIRQDGGAWRGGVVEHVKAGDAGGFDPDGKKGCQEYTYTHLTYVSEKKVSGQEKKVCK